MELYQSLYRFLFNAVTDAVRALDAGDGDGARSILIRAQRAAERRYLEETEPKNEK